MGERLAQWRFYTRRSETIFLRLEAGLAVGENVESEED